MGIHYNHFIGDPFRCLCTEDANDLYVILKMYDARWYIAKYDAEQNTLKRGVEIDGGIVSVGRISRLNRTMSRTADEFTVSLLHRTSGQITAGGFMQQLFLFILNDKSTTANEFPRRVFWSGSG
jgi:uncharacterized protein YerC